MEISLEKPLKLNHAQLKPAQTSNLAPQTQTSLFSSTQPLTSSHLLLPSRRQTAARVSLYHCLPLENTQRWQQHHYYSII